MPVQVYSWRCQGQIQEENDRKNGYRTDHNPYAKNGHDGLAFVWDEVVDPFQPETEVFSRLAKDGYKAPGQRDADCRCGMYMQLQKRDATPEEVASYSASKRVRIPAAMLSGGSGTIGTNAPGVLTGVMAGEAPIPAWAQPQPAVRINAEASWVHAFQRAHGLAVDGILGPDTRAALSRLGQDSATKVDSGMVELVKLLREQFDEARKEINTLRKQAKCSEYERRELTRFIELRAGNEETEMTTTDETVTTKKKSKIAKLAIDAKDAVIEDTSDALWRSAALGVVDTIREAMKSAEGSVPDQYKEYWMPLVKFTSTKVGDAALSYMIGMACAKLPIPGLSEGQRKRIAKELRVGGETTVMYAMVKPMLAFAVSMLFGSTGIMTRAFSGLPKVAEEKPAKGVRVAVEEKAEPAGVFEQLLTTEMAKVGATAKK